MEQPQIVEEIQPVKVQAWWEKDGGFGLGGHLLLLRWTTIWLGVAATTYRWVDKPLGLPGGLESRLYLLFIFSVLGLVMAASVVFRRPLGVALLPEVGLFFLWMLWCFVGGSLDDAFWVKGFWSYMRNTMLAGLTFFLMSGLTATLRSFRPAFSAIAAGAISLVFISLFEGGFFEAMQIKEHRLGTSVGNSNDFAYALLLGLMVAGFYLLSSKSSRGRWGSLALLSVLIGGIVLTGSRKAFVGTVVFLVAGFLFSRGRQAVSGKNIVIALLLLGSLYGATTYILENTYLGERLLSIQSVEDLEDKEKKRLDKYRQVGIMLKEAPLEGIGLGDFQKRSWTRRASHSEYVSIVTETGVIGSILYFGVYIIVLFRLFGLLLQPAGLLTETDRHLVGIMLAAQLTCHLVALGRWNFTTPVHFCMLGVTSGYTWALERALRKDQAKKDAAKRAKMFAARART